MDNIFMVSKEDLVKVMRSAILDRYSDKEVGVGTVCDILDITRPTLDRWVEKGILKSINDPKAKKREIRKFNLAYILGLSKKSLKSEYREVNIT